MEKSLLTKSGLNAEIKYLIGNFPPLSEYLFFYHKTHSPSVLLDLMKILEIRVKK